MKIRGGIALIPAAIVALTPVSVFIAGVVPALADVPGVQVTLEVPSGVAANSDFTVKVNISQVTDFDAASYNVSFDATLLRLDNVTSGQIGSGTVPVDIWNARSAGSYTVVVNIPGLSGASGTGYLAVLHFHNISSQNRTATISLSNGVLSSVMAQSIPATWSGATVNLVGSQLPPPAVPAAPTLARTIAVTPNQVTMAWNDNADNENGFTVQRATDAAFSLNQVSFTAAANATAYTDAGVVPATTYYYRVLASNGSGNSAASNTVTVAVPSVSAQQAYSPPPSSSPLPSTSPASSPAPAPTPGVTSISSMVDISGRFKQDVVIESVPAKTRLTVNRDTVALTKERAPVSQITTFEAAKPPVAPPASRIVGKVYDFGPSGATFDPPIRLTFTYTLADIPQGSNEKDLVIGYWNADTGVYSSLQNSIVDLIAHTVAAPVGHFTAFAIVANISPPALATQSAQQALPAAPATTPSSQTVAPSQVLAPPVPTLSAVPAPSGQGATPVPQSATEEQPSTVNWPVLWSVGGGVAIIILAIIILRARSRYG